MSEAAIHSADAPLWSRAAGTVLFRRQPLARTEPPHPDTDGLRRGGKRSAWAVFTSQPRPFTSLVFAIHAKSVYTNMHKSTEYSVSPPDWINLAQDRDRRWTLINAVIDLMFIGPCIIVTTEE